MRTIAVINQKGGCGKTTTAINLSGFLARAGRRTLLIDMDPQGHATLGVSDGAAQSPRTMYDLFVNEPGAAVVSLRDITRPVFENLDVAPADIVLSSVPEELAAQPGREHILANALRGIDDEYEYAIVDCPPNVGLLTFNALMACSEAIVPMDPSFFSLHGIGKLLETIDLVARKTGHHIDARVVVTLYTGRTPFERSVIDEVRTHLGGRHFETRIRHSVKLAEAASHGVPITNYCVSCVGFADYRALADEVIKMEPGSGIGRDEVGSDDQALAGYAEERARPAPPVLTPHGVVFTIEAPGAVRVQLVGDFNGWALEGSEMQPAGRIWKKVLDLPPGRYGYRYVVDGSWLNDPLNADVEPAPFGGYNSILLVNEGLTAAEDCNA